MAKRRTKRRSRRAFSERSFDSPFPKYIPVAVRRQRAAREAAAARSQGAAFQGIEVSGREIARSAWGRAWCKHIESFSDYASRLPKGKTYVRNGSVIDLVITTGAVRARVMGSELYEQEISFAPCPKAAWARLREGCAGGIGSLVELLEGRFSSDVMTRMTALEGGLLPAPRQVQMSCSCPDWASLCKHLAAVMYGIGARLDERPELLFLLRGVDPTELVTAAVQSAQQSLPAPSATLAGDLGDIFGIDLTPDEGAAHSEPAKAARVKPAGKKGKQSAGSEARSNSSRSRSGSASRRGGVAHTVTRPELLELGIPTGTISTWLQHGVLLATTERGVYRHTAASLERIARRALP